MHIFGAMVVLLHISIQDRNLNSPTCNNIIIWEEAYATISDRLC